jgi:hypothetical protein
MEKTVWGFVNAQPAVYFTTITDVYQFSRIDKCHNLVNPCYICTYLQDPVSVQQFLLAATFLHLQTDIQFCCKELSHHVDSQELSPYWCHKPECPTDKTQHNVAIFTTLNKNSSLPQATSVSSCCALASTRFFRCSNRRSRSYSFILKT